MECESAVQSNFGSLERRGLEADERVGYLFKLVAKLLFIIFKFFIV